MPWSRRHARDLAVVTAVLCCTSIQGRPTPRAVRFHGGAQPRRQRKRSGAVRGGGRVAQGGARNTTYFAHRCTRRMGGGEMIQSNKGQIAPQGEKWREIYRHLPQSSRGTRGRIFARKRPETHETETEGGLGNSDRYHAKMEVFAAWQLT